MDFGLDEGGGERERLGEVKVYTLAELGFRKGSEGRMSKRETDRERERVGYVGA